MKKTDSNCDIFYCFPLLCSEMFLDKREMAFRRNCRMLADVFGRNAILHNPVLGKGHCLLYINFLNKLFANAIGYYF